MNVRTDQVVVYVVRQADDGAWEALQLHRAPGRYLEGQWSFPGGKIEPGETAVEAALRELREETGLVPRTFSHLSYVESFYIPQYDAVWHRPGFCAIVDHTDEVRPNHEHDAFRFIRRHQFASHVLWPGERRALAEVFREHLPDSPGRDRPAVVLRRLDPDAPPASVP